MTRLLLVLSSGMRQSGRRASPRWYPRGPRAAKPSSAWTPGAAESSPPFMHRPYAGCHRAYPCAAGGAGVSLAARGGLTCPHAHADHHGWGVEHPTLEGLSARSAIPINASADIEAPDDENTTCFLDDFGLSIPSPSRHSNTKPRPKVEEYEATPPRRLLPSGPRGSTALGSTTLTDASVRADRPQSPRPSSTLSASVRPESRADAGTPSS